MSLIAILALLQAAVPPVSEAEALAAKSDAETLLLTFGAVKPSDYSEADCARLAKALVKAADATRKDAVIAITLAERAVALSRSVEALTLLGQLEIDVDQRGAAAGHLDEAIKLNPKHVPALLSRGDLAVVEQDFAVAVDCFEPAQAAGAKAAGPKLVKAKAALKSKADEVANLKKTESDIKTRVADATRNATRDWLKQILADDAETSEKHRLAPDGVRKQEMANFAFSYSAGGTSSSDMMKFESRVEKLLDRTYDFVTDKLGHRVQKKTPVMLLTRAEFMTKYAGTPMAQAAGFWDGHEIVINGGSEMNETFAQVMIHEFTHAVVSDLVDARLVPRWLNEGLAENMRLCAIGANGRISEGDRGLLAQLKKQGTLPRLAELEAKLAQMTADVRLAYLLSAVAARILVDQRGYSEYLSMLGDLKRGGHPEPVVESHFMSMERLEQAIADELH